jgi:hypothetical protein
MFFSSLEHLSTHYTDTQAQERYFSGLGEHYYSYAM